MESPSEFEFPWICPSLRKPRSSTRLGKYEVLRQLVPCRSKQVFSQPEILANAAVDLVSGIILVAIASCESNRVGIQESRSSAGFSVAQSHH